MMSDLVMTPREIREAKEARNVKIRRVTRWAPLGAAVVLLGIGALSVSGAYSDRDATLALVDQNVAEHTVLAEEAEVAHVAAMNGLLKDVVGLDGDRVLNDLEIIEQLYMDLASGETGAVAADVAQRFPVASEELEALGTNLSYTSETLNIVASDYTYFSVVTSWEGEPFGEKSEPLDFVVIEITVDKDGTVTTMNTASSQVPSVSAEGES